MPVIPLLRALALGFTILSTPLHAQVPQILNYQGNIAVGTPPVNFNGSGVFRFALVNTDGTTTFWSNDGTSTAGTEPTAGVTLAVAKGLYSVLLGDTTLTNMTAIPATVFANTDVRLRVWFSDGTANGSQLLAPDQRIAAVGYAMVAGVANSLAAAATVPATAITGTIASSQVTGTIPSSQVASAPQGMVFIPEGTFMMGDSLDGFTDAVPVSTTISGFYMDVTEVTLSQWQAVYFWAKDNGYSGLSAGSGKGPDHPVQTVSWYEVVKWCNARSQQAGLTPVYYTDDAQTTIYKIGNVDVTNAQVKWTANGYRLPTEAEWEKAARGGLSRQRFPWGNTITQNLANYSSNTTLTYDLGPNSSNAIGSVGGSPYTSPVASFTANGYGLHDMAGNIWEWCWDRYGSPYLGGTDPKGAESGSGRVVRGGSWYLNATYGRAADRHGRDPSFGLYDGGFRPVRNQFATVPRVPTVTTGTATVGTAFDTFSVSGDVISDGGPPVTRRGIVYGLTATPTLGAAADAPATGSGLGAFASILTGLGSETTYYFRAYATSSIGTGYGAESSFTSGSAIPFVTTGTATVGTAFDTFSVSGNVTSDGGSPVTRRGIVYGLTTTPSLSTAADAPATGSGLGVFVSILTGLGSETTYYFRAYATSSIGTGYGAESSFTSGSATGVGFALIPEGAFTLGDSLDGRSDAVPTLSTTVSAFYIAETEVTLSQWQSVYFWAKDNGYSDLPIGYGKGTTHPVYSPNWYDTVKWCNARSQKEGLTPVYYTNDSQTTIYKTGNVDVTNLQVKWTANGYRLPTEAEWEKAARGGLSGQRFPWGNTINQNLANYFGYTDFLPYDQGPYGHNAIGSVGGAPATSPVGSFSANEYGVSDMAGNVAEWCWDWYGSPYLGGTDPKGAESGSYRVIRGGSHTSNAFGARVDSRGYGVPWLRFNDDDLGFRPARGL